MSCYDSIIESLNDRLVVKKMYLENESAMHNVPANSETHFKLVIVSDNFIEMTKVKRHQLIYQILVETMKKIHALSIQAFTIEEYNNNPVILSSPECSKK
tara:strand:- start:87 stop:386 length:300 start_codon:yes stop_codon:yes gene_type:complete